MSRDNRVFPTDLREAYDRFGPAVHHLAVNTSAGEVEADELTKTTFVTGWLTRRTYDPDRGSPLAWLLGVTRHALRDRVGDVTRADRVIERLIVADELGQLPRDQRTVIEYAFYDNLTHQQIAEATGLPVATVTGHLARSLARLRLRWEDDRASALGTTDLAGPG